MAEHVCPECGTTAGSQPFCENCGLNISKLDRLPTREAWEGENAPPREPDVSAGKADDAPAPDEPSTAPDATPNPDRDPDDAPADADRAGCGGCGAFIFAVAAILALLSWVTGIGPVRDNIACQFETGRQESIVRDQVEEYQAAIADGDFSKACEMVDSKVFEDVADLSKRDKDSFDEDAVCASFLKRFGAHKRSVESARVDGDTASVRTSDDVTLRMSNNPGLLTTRWCDWKVVGFD